MAGQRIDDHSFFAGKKSAASVFPEGVHTKSLKDGEEAAHLNRYVDTADAIHDQQKMNMKKAKSHDMKEGYRY